RGSRPRRGRASSPPSARGTAGSATRPSGRGGSSRRSTRYAPRGSRGPRASPSAPGEWARPAFRRSRAPFRRRRGAQTVSVHPVVVVAVRAALHRLPPGAVGAIPRDRVGEPLLELASRPPPGAPQAPRVERVAAVVSRTVGDLADERLGTVRQRE